MTQVVVGLGVSSRATVEEIRTLITSSLMASEVEPSSVVAIATRASLVVDPRVRTAIDQVFLGCMPRVEGFADAVLIAACPDVPVRPGIPARVARSSAALLGGPDAVLLHEARSAHATAAIGSIALGGA